MELQNSLKLHRKNNSLTQQDLANAVEVSRQTIIAIEKGKYVPSVKLAILIARELNRKVEEVFTLSPQ